MTAILLVMVPKCGLCWAVYMQVFSSVAMVTIPYKPWYLPVAVILFFIMLGKLFYHSVKSGRYMSFALALLGGILVLISKWYFPDRALQFFAIGLLVAGAVLENLQTIFMLLLKRKVSSNE